MEQGSGATHRAPERAAQLLGAVAALRQQIGGSIKGYSQAFVVKGKAAIVGYLWIRMHDAPPLHLLVPRHSMVPVTPKLGTTHPDFSHDSVRCWFRIMQIFPDYRNHFSRGSSIVLPRSDLLM
jgi:hypothetical protein